MQRVECLDGLRGLAALWVVVGHCMLLTGVNVPILGRPDLGVDLFILLSGFLMVFQYQLRSTFENSDNPRTWYAFRARRFFRIAPLFYVMLAIALLCGASIYSDRLAIDAFLGRSPQLAERYTDASIQNIVMHVTFLFGLVPAYAFRTPLPDWSLALEAQFYAVFPVMVLLARRWGWIRAAIGIACVGIALALILRATSVDFPMPAFLPLKLHLFLCGMLIAADNQGRRKRSLMYLGLAVLLAAIPVGGTQNLTHFLSRELIVVGFFALVHLRSFPAINRVSWLLGTKPFHWLGELSFGVYLVHLLLLQPIAAYVIRRFGFELQPEDRFVLVFAVVAAASYVTALTTYFAIERPGQRLGKSLLKSVTGTRSATQVEAEKVAAP